MTTSPSSGAEVSLRSAAPSAPPPEIVHPHPVWLDLRTGTTGSSDVIAHISNIEFVRWIDRAAERALTAAGWSYADLLDRGTMFFVARHEIDYRGEAFADETLRIATWVRDVRRVKSWRDTVIWREAAAGPEIIATAATLWVHVDLSTRRPRRIPDDIMKTLHPLQQGDAPWRSRT